MLFCNDAMVAIATTQVILDLNQTVYAKLVGNSFLIFSAKSFHNGLVLAQLCQKIVGVRFFETRCTYYVPILMSDWSKQERVLGP